MDDLKIYRSVLKFANKISPKNIKKPKFKFLCETMLGILTSKSLVITEIARKISNKEDFISTYKRLNRNLNNYSIEDIHTECTLRNISMLDKNDIVAIDMGDITKPYATKMI